MATVALASVKKVVHQGDRKFLVLDLTVTGTYTVGGDLPATGTLAQLIGQEFELNDLDLEHAINAAGTGAFLARYNEANGRIQLYGTNGAAPAAFAELTAAAIPGGPVTIRAKAWGKGSITAQ